MSISPPTVDRSRGIYIAFVMACGMILFSGGCTQDPPPSATAIVTPTSSPVELPTVKPDSTSDWTAIRATTAPKVTLAPARSPVTQPTALPTVGPAIAFPGETPRPTVSSETMPNTLWPVPPTPQPTVVWPIQSSAEPESAPPGTKVKLTGSGGYLFTPPGKYDESSKDLRGSV